MVMKGFYSWLSTLFPRSFPHNVDKSTIFEQKNIYNFEIIKKNV